MKKQIYIYPIKSLMSHGETIGEDSLKLLNELKNRLPQYQFNFYKEDEKIDSNKFNLILVQSGGSEAIFKNKIYKEYAGPYYLLTYGSCNSLAASLEILTYLKDNNEKGEVLHGDIEYISKRIDFLFDDKKEETNIRLGILGKPSDWLISSDVDKNKCKKIFGIDLIDIDQDEVIDSIKSIDEDKIKEASSYKYDQKEIKKALKIYKGIEKIIKEHNLDGFTIRCFDILTAIKSSACLGLALFNKDDIVASCEGDVPAMLTAQVIKNKLGLHAFQANPQWINPVDNTIEFAHCTLPLDMATSYCLDTHFESGIGVGIHGELKKGPVTIIKIDSSLSQYYVEEGELIENEYRKDRCRTQIKIKLDTPVTYFLKSSLGNHHQIIYGRHASIFSEYLESFGLRRVRE